MRIFLKSVPSFMSWFVLSGLYLGGVGYTMVMLSLDPCWHCGYNAHREGNHLCRSHVSGLEDWGLYDR